jgi:5-methylcytosine-specific restriction endonuclease McrA
MATSSWTEGRLKSFITSCLRGGFRRFPPKYETLKDAFVDKRLNEKTNRVGSHYKCASCNKVFPTKDVQVDHINPIVDPNEGFISWDIFINNLFCEASNLQVLCKPCHKLKTLTENKERKNANSKKTKSK